MKARKRKPARLPISSASPEVVPVHLKSRRFAIVSACLLGVVLFACFLFLTSSQRTRPVVVRKPTIDKLKLPSFGELVMMTKEELAKQDLALLNLRAAEGLPGAEDLDVAEKLADLDRWASRVRYETDRNLHQFFEKPKEFNDSEPYFRMLMLVTVLQLDFGVHYNLERVENVDFTKSKDLFIHGLVGDANGGTCVSMPVLYTAVARRLGYPVYLVHAKEHLFCRWDRENERLNIEGSSRGMNTYDDQHYMSWPHPISKAEVDRGNYLKSLTVAESFSAFLAARGHCLEDTHNRAEASVSYSLAVKHDPSQPMYRSFLSRLVRPKTIEDYPDLLAQQERLRQQREMQFNQFHNPAPPNFGNPISNANAFSRQNQPADPFGIDPTANFSPFPYGVPGR